MQLKIGNKYFYIKLIKKKKLNSISKQQKISTEID